ncbi:gametocyte-specific factor 1 isoform X1 [Alligator mississippiensis]|uniref:gametocyte-specific factor 1 isoform X1 n=1 Tax=Alligator mississippiensis TaxID=8496 RepID=UPI002877E5BE|nr:gametocyte-specific factor 1 isoform X1 [Alligator mississippiensis]
MDPERLLQCPYDKTHQIRACRFPYHLVKCRENNRKVAAELATCPYNARHKVPKRELQLHIATCSNNPADTEAPFPPKTELKEMPGAWQCPPCQEDWEADADGLGAAAPFHLGSRENRLLGTPQRFSKCP